jgi:hypothetical protein
MLGETTNRQYLNVGYGRIRQKCDKENPKAVEHTTQKGDKNYAIEYAFLLGILDGISYRQSQDYGNSWNIDISDGKDHYRLQIPEQSRECGDLLKRIPNLQKGLVYKFTPFDFKKDGKSKKGLSIKDVGDKPTESYYQKYTKIGEDKWNVENIHEFPGPGFDVEAADSDDWKVYFIIVNKFLREKTLAFLRTWDSNVPPETAEVKAEPETHEDAGIPFDEVPPSDMNDLPF